MPLSWRAEKHISLNFLSEVFLYFHEHGVEFMRAPYFSWPQVCTIIRQLSIDARV